MKSDVRQRRKRAGEELPAWVPYLGALVVVSIAAWVRLLLDPVLLDVQPFSTFYAAVALLAWWSGWRAGLLAIVLGYLAGDWFFMKPLGVLGPKNPADWERAVLFVTLSGITVFLMERLRIANRRTREVVGLLQRAEQYFRDMANAVPTLLFEADNQGCATWVSDSWLAYTGQRADEATGWGWTKAIDSEDRGQFLKEWEAARQQGKPLGARHRLRAADGTCHWFLYRAVPQVGPDGQVVRWLGSVTDIDEAVRAEQKLAENRQRLAAILQSAMDAIITVDEQQRVVLFNPAAEKMFRCSAEEALGADVGRFIPQRFRTAHRQHVNKFGETGVTARAMGRLGTLSGLRADGEEFPIEASISQVQVEDQKFYSVILRDITERVLYSSRLEGLVQERTAKLQETVGELEQFSYTITHDMRAPLRAMQAFGQMLATEYADRVDEPGKDYIRRIVESARRMDHLITDALNYAKLVQAKMELLPVDVAGLIRGMTEIYPELQSSKAEVAVDPAIPLVLGNPAGLTQCFSNLLSNAVKFVEPGKQPAIHVWGELRSDGSQPSVRIWVEDNGIGIAPEYHDRIFEMFQRLNKNREGTGIGLALVRKAVERMKGRVGVESSPGRGSRFWVELQPAPQPSSASST